MAYDLSRLNVTIVDGNEYMRLLIKSILKAFGVRNLRGFGDATMALASLKELTPDLVLCELHIAPFDGFEFTRTVRTAEDSPNTFVPIVLMTSYGDEQHVMTACDAGVNDVLLKPISPKALYRHIACIIENPRPFVRTNTYFGPDRRNFKRPDAAREDRAVA